MRCEQIQELFSPYLDNMTSEQDNMTIEAHLGNCFTCSEQFAKMRKICSSLRQLEQLEAPAGFADEVHRRVAEEKIKIFASPEISIPKKPGWIAAGVAGIALTAGIYLSSYLPIGSVSMALNDWVNSDQNRPKTTIEDALKSAQQQTDTVVDNQQKPIVSQIAEVDSNAAAKDNSGRNSAGIAIPQKNSAGQQSVAIQNAAAVQPKVAESYSTKIRVNDMSQSIQQVYQLADAGAEVTLKSSGSTVLDANNTNVKVLELKVPAANAQTVLNSLGEMGSSNPVENSASYTTKYAETNQQIVSLQKQIQTLENKGALSAAEQTQLNALKKQQNSLQSQNSSIDQAVGNVTIEVRLIGQ